MKKRVICILLLSLCLSGCAKPAEPVQMYLLTEIDASGGASPYANPLTCRYNENGLLLEMEKPGYVEQFYYDQKGNLEYRIQTYHDGKVVTLNPNGNVLWAQSEGTRRQCTYDARGNVLTETLTVDGVVERNDRYSYVYTKYGDVQQRTVTDKDGRTVVANYRYTYDKQGRKLTQEKLLTNGGSDIIKYAYNEKGLLLKEERLPNKSKGQTWTYTYDQEGRLLSKSYEYSGLIQSTDYTYDELGRKKTTQRWDHSLLKWTKEWTYDDATGLVKYCVQTDGLGNQTYWWEWTYDDATGELKSRVQTDSDGDQILREYDYGGKLVTIIDGSKRTQFHYVEVTVPGAFVQRVEAEQEKLIDDYLNPNPTVIN